MHELNDDCIVEILKCIEQVEYPIISRVSHRFRNIILHRHELWRYSKISGKIIPVTKFINNFLSKQASKIFALEIFNFQLLPFTCTDEEIRTTVETEFMSSLVDLVRLMGPKLKYLSIEEELNGCIIGDNLFFEQLASHCQNLKVFKLIGSESSGCLSDPIMLHMTMSLNKLEEYYDSQAYGPTTTALQYITDGWPSLHTFHFNTEFMAIETFLEFIRLNGKRFTSLGFMSFQEPLREFFIEGFVPIFKKYTPNLKTLHINLELPNHPDDALFAYHLRALVEECPWIETLLYRVSLSTYFLNSRPPSRSGSDYDITALMEKVNIDDEETEDMTISQIERQRFCQIIKLIKEEFQERKVNFILQIIEDY